MLTIRSAVVGLVAGAGLTFGVAGVAGARPLPLHHPHGDVTPSDCLPSGAWTFTGSVTADVPGGTASIDYGSTAFELPMPVSREFIGMAASDHVDVRVTVSWPDGFVAPTLTLTGHRPAGGCLQTTTTTTTCEHAIPVRDDCGVATTSPTSPPPASSVPPATSTPPTSAAPDTAPTLPAPPAPPATHKPVTHVTTVAAPALPATGSAPAPVVTAGIGAVLAGVALVVLGWWLRRRRSPSDLEGS